MIGAATIPAAFGLIAGAIGLETVPVGAAVLACLLWLLHEKLSGHPDVEPAHPTLGLGDASGVRAAGRGVMSYRDRERESRTEPRNV
jgi:hypothetical protein